MKKYGFDNLSIGQPVFVAWSFKTPYRIVDFKDNGRCLLCLLQDRAGHEIWEPAETISPMKIKKHVFRQVMFRHNVKRAA